MTASGRGQSVRQGVRGAIGHSCSAAAGCAAPTRNGGTRRGLLAAAAPTGDRGRDGAIDRRRADCSRGRRHHRATAAGQRRESNRVGPAARHRGCSRAGRCATQRPRPRRARQRNSLGQAVAPRSWRDGDAGRVARASNAQSGGGQERSQSRCVHGSLFKLRGDRISFTGREAHRIARPTGHRTMHDEMYLPTECGRVALHRCL